jgi:hypothetical protein
VGTGPDRRQLVHEPSSIEMTRKHFDNHGAKRAVEKSRDRDTALFVTALTFGLAMLSLFAVLALAGVMKLAHILPFAAVPLALFIVSGLAVLRWIESEAAEAALEEDAYLSSERPPSKLRPTAMNRVQTRREALEPPGATRR